jgi:hypothetical protein
MQCGGTFPTYCTSCTLYRIFFADPEFATAPAKALLELASTTITDKLQEIERERASSITRRLHQTEPQGRKRRLYGFKNLIQR